MEKNKNTTVKKQNSGGQKKTPGKSLGRIKKKTLFAVISVLLIIVIALAVLLIIALSRNASLVSQSQDNTVVEAEATEAAVSAPVVYPYDDSKWKMEMKNGYLYYDDAEYTSLNGVDVSEWCYDIDWEKVKAAGIDFAICRVGYRGYGTGKFQFDKNLEDYLTQADAAGLKLGVYFVTQAINEEEAVEEAETVLEKIKNYNISMPVYIDCEDNSGEDTRTDDLSKEQWTDNAIAFCEAIEKAGYRAGVYSNVSWIKKNLDISRLTDYDLWFANYTNTPETDVPFTVWQYTNSGTVDGIETAADLNVRLEKNETL